MMFTSALLPNSPLCLVDDEPSKKFSRGEVLGQHHHGRRIPQCSDDVGIASKNCAPTISHSSPVGLSEYLFMAEAGEDQGFFLS